MTRNQFISFCFIFLLIFVAYQTLLIFLPFFSTIFWAAILAFGFYPLHDWLKKHSKLNETFSSFLMTMVIFLIVIPPFIFLIINITAQAIELYQFVSDYVRQGKLGHLIDEIRSLTFVQNIQERVDAWQPLKENLSNWILNTSRSIGNFAANQVANLTKNVFFLALHLFLMFFLIFIFLKDGEKIYGFIYQIAPLEETNKKTIFQRLNETFAAVIRGQILTALIQSIVAGIVFTNLKLPLAIFFALLTFISALIPVTGAATIWAPLAIYLFLIKSYVRAGILFGFGLLVISLLDNMLKPALIGEKTKLPYFLLFFGILGGIKLYGLVGIFIAPVLLALFFTLIKLYQEKTW